MAQIEEAFSSIDLVGQCLMDKERTEAFKNIIFSAVKPDSIVLDVGTGSGIMALFAAQAGAKKVYALEYDKAVAELAKKNFIKNGFANTIELLVDDARVANFPSNIKFDLVIMEMLTVGMVDEFQVQAINNLHAKKVITDKTKLIPQRQDTFISVGSFDFNYYGAEMEMPLHIWNYFTEKDYIPFSNKTKIHSPNFFATVDELLTLTTTMLIEKTGEINCVQLSSQAFLSDEKYLENTISLNPPVIIPINKKTVAKGEQIILSISYKFGNGYQNLKVSLV